MLDLIYPYTYEGLRCNSLEECLECFKKSNPCQWENKKHLKNVKILASFVNLSYQYPGNPIYIPRSQYRKWLRLYIENETSLFKIRSNINLIFIFMAFCSDVGINFYIVPDTLIQTVNT